MVLFTVPTEQPMTSRDLRFAQVVEVPQHEGGALPRWQLSEHPQQVGTGLDASKDAHGSIVVVRLEEPGRFGSEL